jgi:hypothetical protein
MNESCDRRVRPGASGPLPGSGDLIPERLERVDVDLREGAVRLAADRGTGPGLHGRDGAARSATVILVPTRGRNRPVPGPPSDQLRQLTTSAAADLGRPGPTA